MTDFYVLKLPEVRNLQHKVDRRTDYTVHIPVAGGTGSHRPFNLCTSMTGGKCAVHHEQCACVACMHVNR